MERYFMPETFTHIMNGVDLSNHIVATHYMKDTLVGEKFLEIAYWLRRLGYQCWLTLDVFPYREEKVAAGEENFTWIRERFTEIVRRGEGTEVIRLARELLCGKR